MVDLKKLSEQVQKNRTRIRFISILGILYPLLLLFGIVALVAGMVAITLSGFRNVIILKNLALPLVVLGFYLVKALFVRVAPSRPTKKFSEKLNSKFIEAYKDLFKNVKIASLDFDSEFNAWITQTPKGLFGGYENRVTIGIPLMLFLTKDELGAVIAHELGHIKGGHGATGHKEYLRYQRYTEIYKVLHQKSGILSRFYNWYFPYYEKLSFSLRRWNEFEADAFSVSQYNASLCGRALYKTVCANIFMEHFYFNNLWERVRFQSEPNREVYRNFLANSADIYANGIGVCNQLMRQHYDSAQESEYDSHPSLKSRLSAIGYSPEDVPVPEKTAIEEIFTVDETAKLLEEVDHDWYSGIQDAWKERHAFYSNARLAAEKFEQKGFDNLDELEALRYASYKSVNSTADEMTVLYQKIHSKFSSAPAAFHLGMIELNVGNDSAAFAYLNEALTKNPAVLPECDREFAYLCKQTFGNDEDASKKYNEILQAFIAINTINRETSLEPHNLAAKKEYQLQTFFTKHPEIKNVFVARRSRYLGDDRFYCLGIEYNLWHSNVSIKHEKWETKMRDAISVDFPEFKGGIFVFFNNRGFRVKDWPNLANEYCKVYTLKKKGLFF